MYDCLLPTMVPVRVEQTVMHLTDLQPRKSNEDEEDNNTELAYMCTYSAIEGVAAEGGHDV